METSPDHPPGRIPPGVIAPAILLAIMLLLSLTGGLREANEQHLEQAANRAIAAFAVARTINGVVSVIQEMQFGVSLGINTSVQPGQILDPLNDLIERFSNAALIAGTLLWALKLLGNFLILPWIPAALILLLLVRLSLAQCHSCSALTDLLMRAIRTGIVLWGFAAMTPWLINGVHHSDIVQRHYVHATTEMQEAGRQLGEMVKLDKPWDIDRERIMQRMGELIGMADRISEQAIIVLAVFVFEVLIVPLLIFWTSSRVLLHPPRPG